MDLVARDRVDPTHLLHLRVWGQEKGRTPSLTAHQSAHLLPAIIHHYRQSGRGHTTVKDTLTQSAALPCRIRHPPVSFHPRPPFSSRLSPSRQLLTPLIHLPTPFPALSSISFDTRPGADRCYDCSLAFVGIHLPAYPPYTVTIQCALPYGIRPGKSCHGPFLCPPHLLAAPFPSSSEWEWLEESCLRRAAVHWSLRWTLGASNQTSHTSPCMRVPFPLSTPSCHFFDPSEASKCGYLPRLWDRNVSCIVFVTPPKVLLTSAVLPTIKLLSISAPSLDKLSFDPVTDRIAIYAICPSPLDPLSGTFQLAVTRAT